ncbi:lipoate-protein ligase A [Halopolyspora algeriensis]|uniref:Lipoate-protein ligase A n=1 Tax=Halopolyspora algeriensis TaxID=1500506 RepID=A0A368VEY4_9ACTN|nr:lipoate--protein ligase family protein [Halopolyspora algeriensis]RCW39708.1 lipoate-protein ligase A [Halopolyspora algeriensis]TQM53999.1 lipoate-protein ligase A [Halopolyspora algeriensis]
MDLYRGALDADTGQALEVAVAHAFVRLAGQGESGPVLRVYRPTAPVVAFGRRDTLRPGFDAAVEIVNKAGFTPVVRAPGGRAVAYTENSLVVDHIGTAPDSLSGKDDRFSGYADLWGEVLREQGVDAHTGSVPGEYCPGAYSVNARGRVKLVGSAQRILRRAWLFSAVAVFDGADVLRPLLAEVYDALELPFDGDSVGSIRTEAPGLTLASLEEAVLDAYDHHFGLTSADLDENVLATARQLLDDHRLQRSPAEGPSPTHPCRQ